MTKATKAPADKSTKAATSSKGADDAPNDKFLAEQRAELVAERATYVEQAESLRIEAEQLAEDMEPGDIQFDEESGEGDTLGVERERDLLLSAQARAAVEEIDRALAKMDAGTYGVCERCGNPIPKARLKALPYAALCVACKSGGCRVADPSGRPTEDGGPAPLHPAPATTGRRTGLVVAVAAVVLVLDALTKQWAMTALADRPVHLFGSVRLALVHNKAGAFGLGGAFVPFLAVAALAFVVAMVTFGTASTRLSLAVALGLVLGGAFGNVLDRIFRSPGFLRGAVVDFVDVGFWPVFNLADSAITCGCILLLLVTWVRNEA